MAQLARLLKKFYVTRVELFRIFQSTACAVTYEVIAVCGHMRRVEGSSEIVSYPTLAGGSAIGE